MKVTRGKVKAGNQFDTCLYRAIEDGGEKGGYSKGDKIKKRDALDQNGNVVSTTWFNEDTQTPIAAAPPATAIIGWDEERKVLGGETVKVGSEDLATLTAPAGANLAEIQIKEEDTNFSIDGTTTPTPGEWGDGYNYCAGDYIELESTDEIANFKAIAAAKGGTAVLHVTYFCEFFDNE